MSGEKQIKLGNFETFLNEFKSVDDNPNLYTRTIDKVKIINTDKHKDEIKHGKAGLYEDYKRYRSIKVNWVDKQGVGQARWYQPDSEQKDSNANGSDNQIKKFTDFEKFKKELDIVLDIEEHVPSMLLFLAHQTKDNDKEVTQVMSGAYSTFTAALLSYCEYDKGVPPLQQSTQIDLELSFEKSGKLRTQYTTCIPYLSVARPNKMVIPIDIGAVSHEIYYNPDENKVTFDTQSLKIIRDPYKIYDAYLHHNDWKDPTPWEIIGPDVKNAIKLFWTRTQIASTGLSILSAGGGVAGIVVMSVVFNPGIGLAVYLCSQIASSLFLLGGGLYTSYQAKKHHSNDKIEPPQVKDEKEKESLGSDHSSNSSNSTNRSSRGSSVDKKIAEGIHTHSSFSPHGSHEQDSKKVSEGSEREELESTVSRRVGQQGN